MTPTEDPHPEHAKEKMDLLIALAKANDCIAALEAELVSAQASADFFSGELYAANSAFEKLAAEADRLRRENAEWRRMVADLDKATLPFLEDGGRYWCEDAEDALRVMVAALRGE